jgi:hypothetical protein
MGEFSPLASIYGVMSHYPEVVIAGGMQNLWHECRLPFALPDVARLFRFGCWLPVLPVANLALRALFVFSGGNQ